LAEAGMRGSADVESVSHQIEKNTTRRIDIAKDHRIINGISLSVNLERLLT
jgi:hypothetical protein